MEITEDNFKLVAYAHDNGGGVKDADCDESDLMRYIFDLRAELGLPGMGEVLDEYREERGS